MVDEPSDGCEVIPSLSGITEPHFPSRRRKDRAGLGLGGEIKHDGLELLAVAEVDVCRHPHLLMEKVCGAIREDVLRPPVRFKFTMDRGPLYTVAGAGAETVRNLTVLGVCRWHTTQKREPFAVHSNALESVKKKEDGIDALRVLWGMVDDTAALSNAVSRSLLANPTSSYVSIDHSALRSTDFVLTTSLRSGRGICTGVAS